MKVARRVGFGVLVLLPLTLSWAQDDQAGRREEGARRPGAVAAARDTTSDTASQQVISEFATMLAIKNAEEIELCKWALEKTQNDDVREFAQMLIDDHTKSLSKLQQFGPATEYTSFESGATPTSTTNRNTRREERQENREERREERRDQGQAGQDQPGQDQNAEKTRATTRREGEEETIETQVTRRTTVAERGQGSTIHLQVAQETARRCLEMTKEKLGGKEGADFDRCFIGGQIVGHVGMVAKMQAQQQFASNEYSQVLEEGIQAAQKHLKQAESIAQKLEGSSADGAKTGTTTRTREERPNPKEGDNRKEDRKPDAPPNP